MSSDFPLHTHTSTPHSTMALRHLLVLSWMLHELIPLMCCHLMQNFRLNNLSFCPSEASSRTGCHRAWLGVLITDLSLLASAQTSVSCDKSARHGRKTSDSVWIVAQDRYTKGSLNSTVLTFSTRSLRPLHFCFISKEITPAVLSSALLMQDRSRALSQSMLPHCSSLPGD